MPEITELYRVHRPTSLDEVIGQPEAVRVLKDKIKSKKIPHAMMFVGPSGVGKTTVARILQRELDCGDPDFFEINCASMDGVLDTIRDIQNNMKKKPMSGSSRIWLLDEFQSMSRAGFGMQSTLKVLEDTPKHVYFILATTDAQKIIKTIHTRCMIVKFQSLSGKFLKIIINNVLEKEKVQIPDSVVERLITTAEGSARTALVNLDKIIGLQTEEEQLNSIQPDQSHKVAYDLVRALLWEKSDWKKIAEIINSLEDGQDWEGIRHLVLTNASKEALKAGKTAKLAVAILDQFRDNWYDCGKAGLVACCFGILGRK